MAVSPVSISTKKNQNKQTKNPTAEKVRAISAPHFAYYIWSKDF